MEKLKSITKKKSVMNQIISVFILMLIISVLAGLTFLFVANLKTQVEDTTTDAENSTAFLAVNRTETAGFQVTSYLSLIFLALIFGALLTLILRVIMPFINLGQNLGGF